MWSFIDSSGKEYSNLDVEQIRELIDKGYIVPSTKVSSKQFPQWAPASETLFFQKSHQALPTKDLNKEEFQINFNQQVYAQPHPLKKFIKPSLFLLLILICVAPLGYLSLQINKEHQAIKETKNGLEAHQGRLKDKELATEKFAKASEALILKELSLEDGNYKEQERELILLPYKERVSEADDKVRSLALVKQETHFSSSLTRKEAKFEETKSLISYFSVSTILPFLFAIPTFFKASAIIAKKPASKVLGTIHSIPGIHLPLYSVISAKWNLSGTQRRNNLLITLPFSIVATVCLVLGIYLFEEKVHYALTSLVLSYLFWGILHFRQLQMTEYAKNHNLSN